MTRASIHSGVKQGNGGGCTIFAFQNVSQTTDTFTYFGLNHTASSTTDEALVSQEFSSAGTFKNLRINLEGANGVGKTTTVTLRKNGGDTAITCNVTNGTSLSDKVNEVAIAAGDKMNFMVHVTAAATPRRSSGTIEFTPS